MKGRGTHFRICRARSRLKEFCDTRKSNRLTPIFFKIDRGTRLVDYPQQRIGDGLGSKGLTVEVMTERAA